ncbi:zinc finger BED domain-containing protein 4-like [Ranitomeya variabilis]|uniref:zinc finger BED domain-containing protein 4-like n=1 Tax=Ranitomeya variabilis TaxID=490064 RepID=UPI004056BA4D
MKKAVSKARGRGRGAGRGRGNSVPAAGTGDSSAPTFTREQSFMRSFVAERRTPLLREDQIEAVVGWMAANASTSISATSSQTQSTGEQPSVSSPPAKLPRQTESPGQEPSLLLFSESLGLETGGQPSSIGEMEEEAGCSDAQQLFLSESEEAGGPVAPFTTSQAASADDDTQVPLTGACSAAETTREEQLGAEGSVDDEVLDPSWRQGQEGGGSSSEEEIPRMVQRGRGRGKTADPAASALAPVRSMSLPKVKRGAPKTCSAWSFFDTVADDICYVRCKVCHQKIKRGQKVANLNTSNMWKHVRNRHPAELDKHTEELGQPTAAATTSSARVASSSSSHAAGSASSQDRRGRTSGPVVQRPAVIPPAAPLSQSTTHSQPSLQPSVVQAWEKRRPFSSNHPRAQALTAGIAKLLSLEMLSFRLVETDSFRDLMSLAVPQYSVPSRFYFSRQAVPALHKHVEGHIKHALLNAVSSKVHLTTDAWTSQHGQGRYLSLTAHWVNVVEPGTDRASGAGRVLPTPRIAGIHSVRIDSSSYTSSSESSLQEPSQSTSTWTRDERVPVTTDMSTAVAKRQQAVLKLIFLGNRSHTAQELWNAIKQESDVWFEPANLQPGMVVCDNGRNLVAALGLGNLTHIPCLAHVLNLVVQSFLRDYPDLDALLHKVRLECAHLRRSSTAKARIAALQRRHRLPEHRIICDLPTRWNSTLHMLERLCEQQQAVMEYQLYQAHKSRSQRRTDFTTTEWATMKDVCQVLRPFDYSTRMASADDALVSMTVPLICLLEKSLQALRDDVVEEVEDEDSPLPSSSGQSAPRGSSQTRRQGTVCEEDEEESMEEEDIRPEEGVTQLSSTQCVQ